MTKVRADARSRPDRLQRLSVVWASELRLKIVTELYLREMSPKQFREEFGGGSLSRVDKTFKKLAEHGWLRYLRSEGPGGSRRGGVEHFYRATELAIIDDEAWAAVPYSMRVAISWTTFKQLSERVRDALEAGTLTARAGTHLGWTTLALDRAGVERVVGAVNALFDSTFEEQEDAKLRIRHSGESPTPATLGLAVFESPGRADLSPAERATPELVEVEKDCPVPFSLRVSKAFADELCLRIVAEANRREISAPLFHAEVGGDAIEGIRRRFKLMERVGWLKRVNTKTGGRRRSAVEHFYKATGPALLDDEGPPGSESPTGPPRCWTTFEGLAAKVRQALEAGTLEARLDNHVSWSLYHLDREGWDKVAVAADELLALMVEEWEASEARVAESGEEPVALTVGLAAFEASRNSPKVP